MKHKTRRAIKDYVMVIFLVSLGAFLGTVAGYLFKTLY